MLFFFRKLNMFLGLMVLQICFWGQHKIGLVLGVISMYFRVLSYGKCTEWEYFWGCKNFKYFLGCLIFLIFCFGKW